MALHGSLTYVQESCDSSGIEVVPVGKDDDGALAHAQSGDSSEDFGSEFGYFDQIAPGQLRLPG